jgi:UDP-N-acetylmuramyl tripeptide synthase
MRITLKINLFILHEGELDMYNLMIIIPQLSYLFHLISYRADFLEDGFEMIGVAMASNYTKDFVSIKDNYLFPSAYPFSVFMDKSLNKKFRFSLAVMVGIFTRFGLITAGKSATALPGNVALKIEPEMLKIVNKRCKKKIIVTGTNGKTTTNNLISHILRSRKGTVLSNLRGANMPQGIASTFLENFKDSYDWGVFEVDEGSFTRIVRDIEPDYILITNFFRDQLDRYGEIENTVSMVYKAIKSLNTTLILNADDPFVFQFEKLNKNNIFYGIKQNQFSSDKEEIVETCNCPSCNNYIDYEYFNYGQLGSYHCKECGFKNPPYDYSITNIEYENNNYCFDIKNKEIFKNVCFKYEGIYNIYNCCAAFAFSYEIGIEPSKIIERMENFDYKLGRMEEIEFNDKIVKITLVKNPIGITEVIKSISHDERKKAVLLILNDNPADSKDISWIWDAELSKFRDIPNLKMVHCSGKRAEDIALRLKYVNISVDLIKIDDNMQESIKKAVDEDVEIVYILPTYTAVFQTRDMVLGLKDEEAEKWN